MHTIPLIRLSAILSIVFLSVLLFPAGATSEQQPQAAGIQLDALRESGFRIDWMNQSNAKGLRLPTLINESLYTIDAEDHLIRYAIRSGKWLWSAPIGNKVFEIHSITEFPKENLVYIVSDGAVYAIEQTTGNYPSQINANGKPITGQKQVIPLQWIANTPALTTDDKTLIYGSTKGDTVWFNPSVGFSTHRYQIGTSINVQPSYTAGIRNTNGLLREAIVTSSKDGKVLAIDINQVNKLWSLSLTSPVEAPVTYGTNSLTIDDEYIERSSVFIAGTDQYLRAVDLHSGKQRWNILTTSELTDTPFFTKDTVYQRLPDVGLGAFKAFPDDLSGEQLWVTEDVYGNIITTTKSGQLISWDEINSLLQILDPRNGGLVSTLPIPNTKKLITDSKTNGSLYILTNDDVLIRLVPRN